MRAAPALLLLVLTAGVAVAQGNIKTAPPGKPGQQQDTTAQDPDATARAILRQLRAPRAPSVEETRQPIVNEADGGVLRALDMMTGQLEDLKMKNGDTVKFGRLTITLRECRYPVDNPSGDAFAYLTIWDKRDPKPRFQGWVIASSPALSAMDHPRYDVWVLRCNIPAAETASGG
ncbi:MAG: DUF2155 domain-containing protein [Paracoccaceae bacterium]|nr:DUF2155 domain-containing protein [Paracoccaceae bacterium]